MKKLIPVLLITLFLTSCDEIKETLNAINCKYKVENIGKLTWAGIDLTNIRSFSDLSLIDAGKAAAAIANGDYNIGFDLNVLAVNETATQAAIGGFDYILQLDDNTLTSGENPDYDIKIAPNGGKNIIPVRMNVDIQDFISSGSVENVINFARNVVNYGEGKESNIAVKFSPWIPIGSTIKKMPYITLNHTLQ